MELGQLIRKKYLPISLIKENYSLKLSKAHIHYLLLALPIATTFFPLFSGQNPPSAFSGKDNFSNKDKNSRIQASFSTKHNLKQYSFSTYLHVVGIIEEKKKQKEKKYHCNREKN